MPTKPINRVTLLNITIFLEAFLLLAATLWSQLADVELGKQLVFNYRHMLIGAGAGVAMALGGYWLFLLSRNVPLFAQLRDIIENRLIPMLGDLQPFDLIVLALVSGFCEEVFFRGVIQRQFGLPIAAIAFGLMHDPSLRNISYTIVVFLYGLILGALFIYTGNNLWAPIIAHMVHNIISLFILRYRVRPPAAPVSE